MRKGKISTARQILHHSTLNRAPQSTSRNSIFRMREAVVDMLPRDSSNSPPSSPKLHPLLASRLPLRSPESHVPVPCTPLPFIVQHFSERPHDASSVRRKAKVRGRIRGLRSYKTTYIRLFLHMREQFARISTCSPRIFLFMCQGSGACGVPRLRHWEPVFLDQRVVVSKLGR